MVEDLIYDVGMHDGSDTQYYLAKGYRVVAIEANPILVADATKKFQREISAGRLTILPIGVGPQHGEMTFWVNDGHSEWSSFVREVGCRDGTACHPIQVSCLRFRDVLEHHGVPYYLKLDIERNDRFCLEDLTPADLPRYVSVEAHEFDYLCILNRLGYNAFKCVNQWNHNDEASQRINNESVFAPLHYALDKNPRLRRRLRKLVGADRARTHKWTFSFGSSGPFGEETPGQWQTLEETAYNWLHHHLGYKRRGTLNHRGWYDFHATIKSI